MKHKLKCVFGQHLKYCSLRERTVIYFDYAQLVKFPIDVSFWSNFEPVKISQKFNFLPTDYDYRKFLKASRIHRGMNDSNAIFKKFLTAKSVSIMTDDKR